MFRLIKSDGNELPRGGEFTITKKQILNFMKLESFTEQTVTESCDWSCNNYFPYFLTAECDCGEYILLNGHGKEIRTALTDGKAKIINLIPGTEYKAVLCSSDGGILDSFDFSCTDVPPRMIDLPSVDNTRDIGGKTSADGSCRMKYGMVYRGARLGSMSDEDLNVFINILGINTELDLTGGYESNDEIRKLIMVADHSIFWYQNIFNADENYRRHLCEAVRLFADAENYPIYIHCSLGRDRTGTLAFILGALCGLSKEDLYREHLLSFFSCRGDGENAGVNAHLANINALYAGFESFGKPTLRENVETFLYKIGVTAEDTENIRNILCEKSPR